MDVRQMEVACIVLLCVCLALVATSCYAAPLLSAWVLRRQAAQLRDVEAALVAAATPPAPPTQPPPVVELAATTAGAGAVNGNDDKPAPAPASAWAGARALLDALWRQLQMPP